MNCRLSFQVHLLVYSATSCISRGSSWATEVYIGGMIESICHSSSLIVNIIIVRRQTIVSAFTDNSNRQNKNDSSVVKVTGKKKCKIRPSADKAKCHRTQKNIL